MAMGVSPERGGGIHLTRAKGHITAIYGATAAATPDGVPFYFTVHPRAALAFAHLPWAIILLPYRAHVLGGLCPRNSSTALQRSAISLVRSTNLVAVYPQSRLRAT